MASEGYCDCPIVAWGSRDPVYAEEHNLPIHVTLRRHKDDCPKRTEPDCES